MKLLKRLDSRFHGNDDVDKKSVFQQPVSASNVEFFFGVEILYP